MSKKRTSLKVAAMIIGLVTGGSVLGTMSDTAVLLDEKPGDGRTHKPRQERNEERAIDAIKALLEESGQLQRERPDPEAEIHELMDRARRMRVEQVDIQAALEREQIDGEHERIQELRKALVDNEHQLRLTEIELERLMVERDRDAERRDLMTMSDRLDYVAGWRDVAFDPPQAVTMATQAIVELYLAADDPAGAVGELERLLAKAKDLGSRTAIRFALKDLYAELDDSDRAAEQMIEVVLENSRWLEH